MYCASTRVASCPDVVSGRVEKNHTIDYHRLPRMYNSLRLRSISPNHSPTCMGSQYEFDSLAFKPEVLRSARCMVLAAFAVINDLVPDMPSSI